MLQEQQLDVQKSINSFHVVPPAPVLNDLSGGGATKKKSAVKMLLLGKQQSSVQHLRKWLEWLHKGGNKHPLPCLLHLKDVIQQEAF